MTAQAFAAAGKAKAKADIALQPLLAINTVFKRLAKRLAAGEVPSRVVLDFAGH